MNIPINLVYLISLIPFCLIWIILFIKGKYTRREMLVMSFIIGFVSLLSCYYWWTKDWWQPHNITGTKVGIEDFIMGFTAGGIMTSAYEVIFLKRYIESKRKIKMPSFHTVMLILVLLTSWFIWGIGTTTFIASTISMIFVSGIVFYFRKDLIVNGLWSGLLMLAISLFFYYTIIFLSPDWINQTYLFKTLSGIKITGIPIEELVFWFLAGLMWGPLYEYWHFEQLKE